MENRVCGRCGHYLQHYGLTGGKLFRVHCGHCIFSKVRRKQPDTMACENFREAEPDENAFVSKEYLSKELLHYVLNMELLPDIQDDI